jgi:hypothetical protein
MHKESFIINCNTLLHVSTLLGHLQGELLVVVTLGLHFHLSENVLLTVYCVVFGGVKSPRSAGQHIEHKNTWNYWNTISPFGAFDYPEIYLRNI